MALVGRSVRGWALAVGPVGVAGFASGGFRVGLGWPLPEGGGLAFAGAERVVESPRQFGDLRLQFGDALPQDQAFGTRLGHAAMLAKSRSVSCARLPGKPKEPDAWYRPLINYLSSWCLR